MVIAVVSRTHSCLPGHTPLDEVRLWSINWVHRICSLRRRRRRRWRQQFAVSLWTERHLLMYRPECQTSSQFTAQPWIHFNYSANLARMYVPMTECLRITRAICMSEVRVFACQAINYSLSGKWMRKHSNSKLYYVIFIINFMSRMCFSFSVVHVSRVQVNRRILLFAIIRELVNATTKF